MRDHVTFRPADPAEPMDRMEAAADLVRHVRAGNKARAKAIKIRPHTSYSGAVTVRVAWRGDRFHTVKFAVAADGALLVSHKVADDGGALTLMLHDWLTASARYADIRWRTAEELAAGAPGQAAPG